MDENNRPDFGHWLRRLAQMPIYSFEVIIAKCLKSAQFQSYENPWWEFEEIVAVVQPTLSIYTDFTMMVKSGWK